MKWMQIVLIVLLIAVIGVLLNIAFQNKVSIPIKIASGVERISPEDHIKEENIHIYNDRVIIDIQNPQWAAFTDTNSMDPIIDEFANSIQIVPKNESEMKVGDIVSYKSEYSSGIIIHRIVDMSKDEAGTYYYLKGDNNIFKDPGRIRFDQVRRITIGILY